MNQTSHTLNELYRSESAKMLAVLTRIFGAHNFDLAEDVLQEAFNKAMTHWKSHGVPEQPAAWLIKTAKNKAIDVIRKHKNDTTFASDLSLRLESEWSLQQTVDTEFTNEKIQNDLLRMIFLCCGPNIKPENRIPFILRTLCGFRIPAISRALMTPETTIKKRLTRCKQALKQMSFELPSADALTARLDSVHTVLYLLFNEGFYSTSNKEALNRQLCFQAISLVESLLQEQEIENQDTAGLLALMHFHLSRLESRINSEGFNIPLDLQDRTLWDQQRIHTAHQCLELMSDLPRGASGRFPTEALIAREHCISPSFEKTNWQQIVQLYQHLLTVQASPVVKLNHAIAVAYAGSTQQAIDLVTDLSDEKSFAKSHLPLSVLAHLHAKLGDRETALSFAEASKAKGGTAFEQQLMSEQLERLLK